MSQYYIGIFTFTCFSYFAMWCLKLLFVVAQCLQGVFLIVFMQLTLYYFLNNLLRCHFTDSVVFLYFYRR